MRFRAGLMQISNSITKDEIELSLSDVVCWSGCAYSVSVRNDVVYYVCESDRLKNRDWVVMFWSALW